MATIIFSITFPNHNGKERIFSITYLLYVCLAISLFSLAFPAFLHAGVTMHVGNSEPLIIGAQNTSSFTRNEKGDRLTKVAPSEKKQSANQQNATQNFIIYPEVNLHNGPNLNHQHNGKPPRKNPKPPSSHKHRPMPR